MIRLGFQLSISGGIYKAVSRARSLGCTTMQIFSHNPRGWALKELSSTDISLFRRLRQEAGISPLCVHTAYLINLASSNRDLYRRSKEVFLYEIERADLLGADYLITHLGSTHDDTQGIKRVIDALITISQNINPKSKILLENTAGERGEIGHCFEQLSEILNQVEEGVGGICFDTCHAFQAGYDLSNVRGIDRVLNDLNSAIGLDSIKIIHANDSKKTLGSRIDRHEEIGKGWIGIKGFRAFLNHPRLKGIPLILETPRKSDKDDIRNLRVIKKLLKETN